MKNKLHKLLSDNKNMHFKSKTIEAILNIEGANVRKIIQGLRRNGIPIASNNRKGYTYATKYEEIEKTIQHLEHRAMSMLVTCHKLRKIFNREKQYKFDFEEYF